MFAEGCLAEQRGEEPAAVAVLYDEAAVGLTGVLGAESEPAELARDSRDRAAAVRSHGALTSDAPSAPL